MEDKMTLEEELNALDFDDDFDGTFIHDEDSFSPMELIDDEY